MANGDEERRKAEERAALEAEQRRQQELRAKQQGGGSGVDPRLVPRPPDRFVPEADRPRTSTLTGVLGNQLGIDTQDPLFWPKFFGTQGVKAATDIAGLPRVLQDLGEGSGPFPSPFKLPSTEDMNRFLFGRVVPWQETDLKGPLGKTINETLKGGVGGALFKGGRTVGGAVTNALGGGSGAVAAELAPEGLELPAAIIAGGAPGAVHGGYTAGMKTTPARVAAERLKDLTPAEIQDAIRRQAQASAQDIWLSPGEAARQGPNAGLLSLEGNIAQSPGGAVIQRALTDRIEDIENRHRAIVGEISPTTAVDPVATDRALGTSASRQIDEAKAQRSRDAEFLLDAGKRQRVPLDRVRSVIDDIDNLLRDPTMDRGSAAARELRELRGRLTGPLPNGGGIWTNQNVGALHTVLEDYEAVLKGTAFQGDPARVNAVRVHVKPVLDRLRGEMFDASDRYRRGWQDVYAGQTTGPRPGPDAPHDTGRQVTPQTERVEALERGAAGDVKAAQPGTDYPNQPPPGTSLPGTEAWKKRMGILDPNVATPTTIRRDVSTMDATTQQQVLAAHLESELANAFAPTQGQPQGNVKGGATYAGKVAGMEGSRRAQNLYALAEAVTGSPQTAQGLRNFVDIVRLTGQIPGAGSPTHGRGALGKEASQAGTPAGAAFDVVTSPFNNTLAGRVQQWRERGTYAELADIIRQPNSMELLHKLALLNPNSARAQAIVRTLLGAGRPAAQDVKPTPEEGQSP